MNLIGNQKRWAALARATQHGRIPQTLLVSGPPHVGKSTLALAFSRLLLCPHTTQDENGLPAACGSCTACHQVERGTFPDYRLYRPLVASAEERDWVYAPEFLDSSIIPVSMARKVTQESTLRPTNGPRKVIVIQQIDRMTEEAQNALLKTFEEPPAGLYLLLTAENPRRIRETILSRCWHLPLTPASEAEVTGWLGSQFPAAAPAQIEEAVRAGGGRPGLAYRALERALEVGESGPTRFQQALALVTRIESAAPVGALGFTEEALKLARQWWEEDAGDGAELKKAEARVKRASAARFLDELAAATRARWAANPAADPHGPLRLDLIRKTRQYILRNANPNLALDVLFVRLIALRRTG